MRYLVGIYTFKVNNRNTRTRCEICSKLTTKTLERRHWRITYFTYFIPCSIINFEKVNADWVWLKWVLFSKFRAIQR